MGESIGLDVTKCKNDAAYPIKYTRTLKSLLCMHFLILVNSEVLPFGMAEGARAQANAVEIHGRALAGGTSDTWSPEGHRKTTLNPRREKADEWEEGEDLMQSCAQEGV